MAGLLKSSSLIIIAALLPAILSCNNSSIESKWLDRDIVIDGNYDDWEGELLVSEEKGASLGFFNDDQDLYLCLVSSDRSVLMRALKAGFLVQFDGGRKNGKIGIRYPVGGKIFSPEVSSPGQKGEGKGNMGKLVAEQSDLFLILNDRPRLFNLTELYKDGISVKIGQYKGQLVYEMQIPLHKSDARPYAIDVRAGKPVRTEFELGKMERPEVEGRRPEGGFPGMGERGEMGEHEGGERGFPGGGRRFERQSEFKFEVSVELAKNPAAQK